MRDEEAIAAFLTDHYLLWMLHLPERTVEVGDFEVARIIAIALQDARLIDGGGSGE